MTSTTSPSSLPFNSALETGVRSACLLVAAHPLAFDLQRLVSFDYLVVHTGDIGGPESLHPALPMRSAELLVRRGLVERGLLLMLSRGLVDRELSELGITYRAGEFAETFLASLDSPYLHRLRERAQWVADKLGSSDEGAFRETMETALDRWMSEFQAVQASTQGAT